MRFRLSLSACFVVLSAFISASSSYGGDDDAIQLAIQKGARYLQGIHKPDRGYSGGVRGMGSATLAGLALLESGIPASDPALQTIIQFVRKNALSQTSTYELSLTIMFLDKLGNEADQPIIQFLGIRLMAGQGATGGWTYDCGYGLTPQEEVHLKSVFFKESKLATAPDEKEPVKTPPKKEPVKSVPRPDLPADPNDAPAKPESKKSPAKKEPADAPAKFEGKLVLHPEVVKYAKMVNQSMARGGNNVGDGDNSNTQFAALGLWCARKHGVPCEKSFALLETRFRTSQDADGGWSYHYRTGGGGSTATMTCAGLIGMAVSLGAHQAVLANKPDAAPPAKKDNRNAKNAPGAPEDDATIKKGIKCLGNYLTDAKGMPPEGKINRAKRGPRFRADVLNQNLYFLWSLERVAVIYGLETVGNHDWYVWGSDALIDAQRPDGSWNSLGHGGAEDEISTCFALLFLSRANVARDLTVALRGKIMDPGLATLRGGGDNFPIGVERPPAKIEPSRGPAAKADPIPAPAVSATDVDGEATRLSTALLNATADARPALLAKLRESKGAVYTEALARAAANASGEFQQEIREAFARRLARMTAATLREMLKDEHREIRAAAAHACARKEDKQFIPNLIDQLSDADAMIVQAARSSLRALSGKDFGPAPEADAPGRIKSAGAWRDWWREQGK